ncbi:nucleic acid/nucleotide deaminase domain-containing protein [Streptomyces chitinivorans]|uniref:Nucleic acid/nucleotide deaminase domain-containing protein n=1 Tax=Streptomyces chitinivorans TaxID=1257027 RepID=A0ABW7HWU8_9ACTN|nr:nucleic acid/nucleotide deaminase domain-containing protein [Streptomyces chitinivorans]MDH2407525.1 nucleic acid/nucleotide deaminase domain-containing protein [Streptomyces chitinivorans]
MGIQVPEDLRDIMELVGIDWPDIDEDELRDTAKEYRDFADELRDTIQKANRACSHITAGSSKGEAVDAFKLRWGKVSGQDMKNLAKAVDVLADAMDSGAGYVTTCKLSIIGSLTTAAVSITGSAIAAFFTGGLTALLGAAAAAALRQAVKEALDLLVSKLVELAVEKIEGEVLGLLEGLFDGRTGSGGRDRNGKLLPEGSDALGQELWIEFAEFEDAIAELGDEHDRFTKKKDGFTGKREKRSLVSKKDDRFAKFGAAVDKAEDKVELSAHKMSKELERNVDGLDTTKRSNDKNEKDTKDRFDNCRRHDDDEVRTYILNSDGSVDRLLPNGTLDPKGLDSTDRANLVNITDNGKVWRPESRSEQRKWHTKKGHTGTVSSRRVAPSEDELGQATQLARKARNDYGGGNYAAGRYIDPENGRESILVGYSDNKYHSERNIGHPLLHKGMESGLKEIFTEREPCQKSPRCDRWLDCFFKPANPDLEVTYAARYDQSNKETQNNEHENYISELKKNHRKN